MQDETSRNQNDPLSSQWILCCLGLTGALLVIAWFELLRVEDGHLFAVALPWDAPASELEIRDARDSAAHFRLPALMLLGLVGTAAAFSGPKWFANSTRASRDLNFPTLIFLLSVMADLGTTLWFFHDGGINLELHPGIRLFGYAYGRSIGPVAAKTVQAIGILVVSRLMGRGRNILLVGVSCLYVLAAAYNMSQM